MSRIPLQRARKEVRQRINEWKYYGKYESLIPYLEILLEATEGTLREPDGVPEKPATKYTVEEIEAAGEHFYPGEGHA